MLAAGQMDVDRAVELRRASRTRRRSPRRGAWCRRPRTCSRHCRCRRPGRRGSRWPWSRARSPRSPLARRRRASSATPEIRRFCQTVRRMSPSPKSRAIAARPRICVAGQPCRPAAPRRSSSGPAASADARRYGRCDRRRGRGAIASVGTRTSLRPSFSSIAAEEFLEAPGVEHVFQPRLGAVGAVAIDR